MNGGVDSDFNGLRVIFPSIVRPFFPCVLSIGCPVLFSISAVSASISY